MARDADFYQKQLEQRSSAPSTGYQSPLLNTGQQQQSAPAAQGAPRDINDPKLVAATNRGFWSFFGEGLREIVTNNVNPNTEEGKNMATRGWDDLSGWEKYKTLANGASGLAINMATALPKTVLKAPIGVGYTALEAVDSASMKLFGTKQAVPDKLDLTGIFGDNAVARYFGDVSGVRMTYKDAKAMGNGGALDTFLAAVVSTGKFTGDLAISGSLVNSMRGAFKPTLRTVESPVYGPDFRPMTPTQTSTIRQTISDAVNAPAKPGIMSAVGQKVTQKLGLGNPVTKFQQNPNASFFQLPVSAAKQYGGNPSNTFLRVSPAGSGTAEVSVVQLQPSLASRIKTKFSSSKGQIVETEMGTAIKVDSGLVKYDASIIAKNGDALPPWLAEAGAKPGAVSVETAAALPRTAGPSVASSTIPTKSANFQRAETEALTALGKETNVMQPPLRGFESSIVEPKQIGQINYIAQQRNISDENIAVITNVLTGKGTLADLTQKEAFDVSETLRMFNQPGEAPATDLSGFGGAQPFVHPARYWMEASERQFNVPIYSKGYIPIETGFRMADRALFPALDGQIRNIWGKFANPKFVEEQRLVTSYLEGNTKAISENKTLTDEAKAELTYIADQSKEFLANLFERTGIGSQRFKDIYAPHIRQLGTIYELYKSADLPPEFKPFYEFERQGTDAPLEDNALALMQIYAKQFARSKFLKEPMNEALMMAENLPPKLKENFNSYLQEKLGYQGEYLEKGLNDLGKSLSKHSSGAIPPDIFRRTINMLMTNSYAATIGLPRVAPIIAQGLQFFIMNFAEFGGDPKTFVEGMSKALSKDSYQKLKDKGFLVDQPVMYGADLASQASSGRFGRLAQKYEDFNKALLKGNTAADNLNRVATYYQVTSRFQKNWQGLMDGKLSYEQFEKEINMDGFNPTLQKIIREKFVENTPESLEAAEDLMAQDILDSLHFPYRKGSESRAFYGLGGKMAMQYLTWPFEYAHTLRSWAARGQYGKMLRWYGMFATLDRTFDEALGVNIKKYVGLGPVAAVPFGPLANAAIEGIKGFVAKSQDLNETANDHWRELSNTLVNYGGAPFGIGMKRLSHFKMSVDRRSSGNGPMTDPEKPFGIYSSTGKLKAAVDFGDLLKYTFGLMPTEVSDSTEVTNNIKKDTLNYNNKMTEAMNAFVDGDYEKFDKIVTKNNLVISDLQTKMESYQIPLDQRMWSRMPKPLQEKYINIFYPEQ